jgi:hypothetical protein
MISSETILEGSVDTYDGTGDKADKRQPFDTAEKDRPGDRSINKHSL